MRPKTEGFQKPLRPTSTKKVGLAMVRDDERGVIDCTCGWVHIHPRKKVREDAAERHLNKRHGGIGAWL